MNLTADNQVALHVQVLDHLSSLADSGGEDLLQAWPGSGLTVEQVFSRIFKFLQNEVLRNHLTSLH